MSRLGKLLATVHGTRLDAGILVCELMPADRAYVIVGTPGAAPRFCIAPPTLFGTHPDVRLIVCELASADPAGVMVDTLPRCRRARLTAALSRAVYLCRHCGREYLAAYPALSRCGQSLLVRKRAIRVYEDRSVRLGIPVPGDLPSTESSPDGVRGEAAEPSRLLDAN